MPKPAPRDGSEVSPGDLTLLLVCACSAIVNTGALLGASGVPAQGWLLAVDAALVQVGFFWAMGLRDPSLSRRLRLISLGLLVGSNLPFQAVARQSKGEWDLAAVVWGMWVFACAAIVFMHVYMRSTARSEIRVVERER